MHISKPNNMLVTTTNTIEGKRIVEYYGLVSGETIIGANLIKDLFASISAKTVSARYDVGGYQQEDVLLENFFLLNAYAEYKWKTHVKFFAGVQNITNKKFFDLRGYNSIPFMLNGGITFNW